MKKIIASAALTSLLLITLSGCKPPPPTVFGVRESVWKTLSPQEKRQVIKGYNQTQKINAQNAPVNNVIGATNAAVQEAQYQRAWRNNIPSPPPLPNFNN